MPTRFARQCVAPLRREESSRPMKNDTGGRRCPVRRAVAKARSRRSSHSPERPSTPARDPGLTPGSAKPAAETTKTPWRGAPAATSSSKRGAQAAGVDRVRARHDARPELVVVVGSAAGLGRSRRIDAGRSQQLHRDVGRDGADDRGAALATKPGLGRLRRRLRDPVALVQHDEIGGGELAVDGVPEPFVAMARANRLRVGEDHDEVARETRMQGRDVRDRGRVRDAARLHQDLLRASISVQEAVDGAHEVVPDGASRRIRSRT